jgi:hypothetical protein
VKFVKVWVLYEKKLNVKNKVNSIFSVFTLHVDDKDTRRKNLEEDEKLITQKHEFKQTV